MMGPQARAFLQGEGKAWLDRNINKLSVEGDPVLEFIKVCKLNPTRVLEIGCANGWRLDELKRRYDCEIAGVDPGVPTPAIRDDLYRGTASMLPIIGKTFDMVIYGWCLYLCDPQDYFFIAAYGDSYLREGGHLVIHDFYSGHPIKRAYKHKKGLFSYKMDFAKLWSWNPSYSIHSIHIVDDETRITILKKRNPIERFEDQT